MKLPRTLALMIAFATLAGGSVTLATAQEAKSKPKTAKADDKAKTGGKIEIYEAKKGWRFRILNSDNKTIAMPTRSFEKKDDVMKELDLIKSILNSSKPVEVKE